MFLPWERSGSSGRRQTAGNQTCSVIYNTSGGDEWDGERVKWKRAEEGLGWEDCSWCRVVRAAACAPLHCVHLAHTSGLRLLPERNTLLVSDQALSAQECSAHPDGDLEVWLLLFPLPEELP